MGYTTRFDGQFTFNKALTVPQYNELKAFSEADHRMENGVPYYFCQWIPTDDGMGLKWDGREKFYEYKAWLPYLIKRFFQAWGIVLNGEVTWQGEEVDDRGTLYIKDNQVNAVKYERDPTIPICSECGFSYDAREPHAHS